MDAGTIIALTGFISTPVLGFMGWTIASLLRIERLAAAAVSTMDDHERRMTAVEAEIRAVTRAWSGHA